jgi:hypothetical protein
MVKINPINFINMLMDDFRTNKNVETPLNSYEIEMKDHLKGIIDSCMRSAHLNIEVEQDLDFEDGNQDHSFILDDIEELQDDEDDEET